MIFELGAHLGQWPDDIAERWTHDQIAQGYLSMKASDGEFTWNQE